MSKVDNAGQVGAGGLTTGQIAGNTANMVIGNNTGAISGGNQMNINETGTMSKVDNAGQVGAGNAVNVKGGHGPNAALGNTTGAEKSYDIKGGLTTGQIAGNTANMVIGNNTGAISGGNQMTINK